VQQVMHLQVGFSGKVDWDVEGPLVHFNVSGRRRH